MSVHGLSANKDDLNRNYDEKENIIRKLNSG